MEVINNVIILSKDTINKQLSKIFNKLLNTCGMAFDTCQVYQQCQSVVMYKVTESKKSTESDESFANRTINNINGIMIAIKHPNIEGHYEIWSVCKNPIINSQHLFTDLFNVFIKKFNPVYVWIGVEFTNPIFNSVVKTYIMNNFTNPQINTYTSIGYNLGILYLSLEWVKSLNINPNIDLTKSKKYKDKLLKSYPKEDHVIIDCKDLKYISPLYLSHPINKNCKILFILDKIHEIKLMDIYPLIPEIIMTIIFTENELIYMEYDLLSKIKEVSSIINKLISVIPHKYFYLSLYDDNFYNKSILLINNGYIPHNKLTNITLNGIQLYSPHIIFEYQNIINIKYINEVNILKNNYLQIFDICNINIFISHKQLNEFRMLCNFDEYNIPPFYIGDIIIDGKREYGGAIEVLKDNFETYQNIKYNHIHISNKKFVQGNDEKSNNPWSVNLKDLTKYFITFHTHPKIAYFDKRFLIYIGWPSQPDMISLIYNYVYENQKFHYVFSYEGIYSCQLHVEFMHFLNLLESTEFNQIFINLLLLTLSIYFLEIENYRSYKYVQKKYDKKSLLIPTENKNQIFLTYLKNVNILNFQILYEKILKNYQLLEEYKTIKNLEFYYALINKLSYKDVKKIYRKIAKENIFSLFSIKFTHWDSISHIGYVDSFQLIQGDCNIFTK